MEDDDENYDDIPLSDTDLDAPPPQQMGEKKTYDEYLDLNTISKVDRQVIERIVKNLNENPYAIYANLEENLLRHFEEIYQKNIRRWPVSDFLSMEGDETPKPQARPSDVPSLNRQQKRLHIEDESSKALDEARAQLAADRIARKSAKKDEARLNTKDAYQLRYEEVEKTLQNLLDKLSIHNADITSQIARFTTGNAIGEFPTHTAELKELRNRYSDLMGVKYKELRNSINTQTSTSAELPKPMATVKKEINVDQDMEAAAPFSKVKKETSKMLPIAFSSTKIVDKQRVEKKAYAKLIASNAYNRTTKHRPKVVGKTPEAQAALELNKQRFKVRKDIKYDALTKQWASIGSGISKTPQEAAAKWTKWVSGDKEKELRFGVPGYTPPEANLPYIPYVGGINRGSIAPYYVEMGVIRGGGHRKGIHIQNNKLGGSGDGFAIPMVDSTNRKLISLQAKYKNPLLFPHSRIIKFIAGRFGEGYDASNRKGTTPVVTTRPF